jgi:hypothetical protein
VVLDSWRFGVREGVDCTLAGCGSGGWQGWTRGHFDFGVVLCLYTFAASYDEAWRGPLWDMLGEDGRSPTCI